MNTIDHVDDTPSASAGSSTSTSTPPPPPSFQTREVVPAVKEGDVEDNILKIDGSGPFITVKVPTSLLVSQKKISEYRLFEIYKHIFFQSFVRYAGLPKPFTTDEECYRHYIDHFVMFYGPKGWISTETNLELEIRCHLSWILEIDVFEQWTGPKVMKHIHDRFHIKMFKYLQFYNLFHPTYYVHKDMKRYPNDTIFQHHTHSPTREVL